MDALPMPPTMSSLRPVPRPATRPVFVVTTRGGRHLFGVHRADERDQYTSYILGFDRNEHAMALAKGLEAYRRATGRFPPRDLTIADMDLTGHNPAAVKAMEHVAVDQMQLPDLLWRLRGTGIVLSLLTAVNGDGGDEDDWSFRWEDIRSDPHWPRTSVQRLNQVLRGDKTVVQSAEHEQQAVDGGGEVPALQPRPAWPGTSAIIGRVLAALCELARRRGSK